MPAPTIKTAKRIERMLGMHAAGASAREIAGELGVNHRTAVIWLRDAGLKPNGGHGSRAKRERVSPNGAAAALTATQQALAHLSTSPEDEDLTDSLAQLGESLSLIRGLIRYYEQGVRAGTSNIGELDKAMVVQDRLLTRMEELKPRDAVKPEDDPGNLDAANETRARLAALVEAAERDFRCMSCGKDPYGRARP